MKKGKFLFLTILLIIIIILPLIGYIIFNKQQYKKNVKLISLIEKYYTDKEYSVAKNLCEKILEKNPNDRHIIILLDKILKAEKEKKQIEEFEKDEKYRKQQEKLIKTIFSLFEEYYVNHNNPSEITKKINNSEIDTLLKKGIEYYHKKEYQQAKNIFYKIISIDPDNPYANAYLAATLFSINPEDNKKIKEISDRCKKAITQDNTIEIAHYILAKVYQIKGLNDFALNELNETLSNNPNNYNAYFTLGKIYYELKDFNNAEIQFNNSIKIKKDFINGLYFLAQTELELGKYQESMEHIKKILLINPYFYNAYAVIGDIYVKNNNFNEAINYYENAINIQDDYIYRFKVGECYKNLEQYNNALDNYNKSNTLNPLSNNTEKETAINIYKQMAKIKIINKSFNEAIDLINMAKNINDKDTELYFLTAGIKLKINKNIEAIDDYLKIIEIDPYNIDAYLKLSCTYNDKQDYNKAVDTLHKALILNKQKDRVYQNLGISHYNLKNYEDAINYFNKSIELNNTDYKSYYYTGLCYKEKDNLKSAIDLLNKSIELSPDFYDAYFELGKAYFINKKYSKAKSSFNFILKNKPDYIKRNEIITILKKIGA